jgi:hypothetical protein
MTSPPTTASGIKPFADEPQEHESRRSPLPTRHKSPPANAGAHERRGPRGDDQRSCPARTRYGGHDLVKAVIDGQPGEEGDTKNSGQNGETAHLPAKSQTERHKLPRKSSFGAKLRWSARCSAADLASASAWPASVAPLHSWQEAQCHRSMSALRGKAGIHRAPRGDVSRANIARRSCKHRSSSLVVREVNHCPHFADGFCSLMVVVHRRAP